MIGVVAGGALLFAAAPEIFGGAAIVGTLGIVTGTMAAAGSAILLYIDGQAFVAEVTGNEARAEALESSHTNQWLRITATMMLLPDLPVGGVRAITELTKLGREAEEAGEAVRLARARAVAQRERAGRIHHPQRHPGPVNRHLARANRATREAIEQQAEIARATHRMRIVTARDINASFVATPGSVGLLAGLPPAMLLSSGDRARDEQLLRSLAPEHGMPRDVRLEARMSGTALFAGHH